MISNDLDHTFHQIDSEKQINLNDKIEDPILKLQINEKCYRDCFHIDLKNNGTKNENLTTEISKIDQTVPSYINKSDPETSEFSNFSSLNFYKQCSVSWNNKYLKI